MPERRPRSIYERATTSTVPPPDQRVRFHAVDQYETLISIANKEYGLAEYDPALWRDMGLTNGVQNPFTVDRDFAGASLKIPPKPLPDFL